MLQSAQDVQGQKRFASWSIRVVVGGLCAALLVPLPSRCACLPADRWATSGCPISSSRSPSAPNICPIRYYWLYRHHGAVSRYIFGGASHVCTGLPSGKRFCSIQDSTFRGTSHSLKMPEHSTKRLSGMPPFFSMLYHDLITGLPIMHDLIDELRGKDAEAGLWCVQLFYPIHQASTQKLQLPAGTGSWQYRNSCVMG